MDMMDTVDSHLVERAMRFRGIWVAATLAALVVAMCGCPKDQGKKPGSGASRDPVPVRIAEVVQKSMPVD